MSIPANSSGGANNLGLPYQGVPLVDKDTGLVSRVWWPFFQNLYDRVGGSNAASITQIVNQITSNLAIVPPPEYDNAGGDSSDVIPGPPGAQGPVGPQGVPGFMFSSDSDIDFPSEALSFCSMTYNIPASSGGAPFPSGSAPTPSINYSAATTTGMYWANPGLGYSVVGTSVGTMTSTGLNGMAVGATTPSTGAFTTLSATGAITPSTTNGIIGTTAANSANAGSLGEFVSSTVTGVSLTTNTQTNITSISLTAGDWDVGGMTVYAPALTTTLQLIASAASLTSATLPVAGLYASLATTFQVGGNALQSLTIPPLRVNVSATTTVFLVATSVFGTSTCTANGFLRARRVR